ncbi:hypothetical protein PQX77_008767, partial [Marasmius sp. AFHP31]
GSPYYEGRVRKIRNNGRCGGCAPHLGSGVRVKKLERPRMERRGSPRKGSVTPEVPQVVIPPAPKAIREWRRKQENKEKPQKHVRISEPEVSVSIRPNTPPPKRREKQAVVPTIDTHASSEEEDELSEDTDDVNPVGGKTGKDKDATPVITPPPSAKRPFDDVPAVSRPAIPRDHVVSISDVAGHVRDVFPNTDTLKLSKGPHKPQGQSTSEVIKRTNMKATDVEEDIVERMMKQELSVTQEELLAISPGVKKIFQRKAKNRAVRRTAVESFIQEVAAEDVEQMGKVIGNEASYVVQVSDMDLDEQFEVLKVAVGDLPAGAVVQKDITEVFRQDIESNERSKIIIVASTSDALRSVYPVINRSDEVECILDSGSQIIAMDMMVAVGLGVHWDPDTVIHMQGANGQLKKTRGLARNVPFRFGDLTFYLQLHILDGAPYKVLLGRPFDVLSESQILNYADGYQQLTIRCPNSGHRSTIGTYPRGQGKKIVPRRTEHTLTEMGRPSEEPQSVEETEGEKEQSQANNYSSEEAGNFHDTLRN